MNNNQIQSNGQNQNNQYYFDSGVNNDDQSSNDYGTVDCNEWLKVLQSNVALQEEAIRALQANLNVPQANFSKNFNIIQANLNNAQANLNRVMPATTPELNCDAKAFNFNNEGDNVSSQNPYNQIWDNVFWNNSTNQYDTVPFNSSYYNKTSVNSVDYIEKHNVLSDNLSNNGGINFNPENNINSNALYVKPPKRLVAPKLDVIALEHPNSSEVSIALRNSESNRYPNIMPKNSSIFAPTKFKGVDLQDYYLNASKIKFCYLSTNAYYIAAQAPRKQEFNSFFKAVVVGCSSIINLAMPIEMGRPKCDDYWSDEFWSQYGEKGMEIKDGTNVIGVLKKTKKDVHHCDHNGDDSKPINGSNQQYIIERTFQFTSTTGNSRTIKQYHYQRWPDHGSADIIQFNKLLEMMHRHSSSDKPPMIHCSAGVGRTGTLISTHFFRRFAKDCDDNNIIPPIDSPFIVQIIEMMRGIRPYMVQSQDQLDMIYSCVNTYLGLK